MKTGRCLVLAGVACVLVVVGGACGGVGSQHDGHEDGAHQHHQADEYARGPHRGRLLVDGDFAIELSVFEEGVPPRFRVYGFEGEKPLNSNDLTVTVTTKRLGGEDQLFRFIAQGDLLDATAEVAEPHSFDVVVTAEYRGARHSWSFSSYEGRTTIPANIAERAGVRAAVAGARRIESTLAVRGKVVPSEHRVAHVIPRFSGVVREGRKHIGDPVQKGEVLAIIESNQSLQPFEVKSQIAGTIVNGHLIVGEFVPENQWVYIVADISEVWAEFSVPLRDRSDISLGQRVLIRPLDSEQEVEGKVHYISPYADERTQSQIVRVVVPNSSKLFMPGMFASARIVTGEGDVPVAVKQEALQTFRDWQVVFVKVGDTYEVRPVQLGRSDGLWVEVLSGLAAGEEYVAESSFTIKADILKSGASHDH
jgi:cobalt-zinc-cadmium efflux system membrane fusion protein